MAPTHIKSAAMNNQTVIDTRSAKPHAATVAHDVSGYEIFSGGDQGAAHVLAHHMVDTGQCELGRQLLGRWLDDHAGSGSQWVHLHFHMAIFELATGHWDAAYRRYLQQVLPTAQSSEDALTDAPALLWRLALSAPEGTELEWEPLRKTALKRMRRPSDSFTELHNLLALAGAGDLGSLDTYMKTCAADSSDRHLVCRLATALLAYVKGHYYRAADLLWRLLPRIPEIGGSRAQIQLFEHMAAASLRRATSCAPQAQAA
jgi:thioredoxin-like negative regulator of GroEL